jgi:retinol dehydrogenase-12
MLGRANHFSELTREIQWKVWILKVLLARTTEVGSRTLVDATTSGPESHGEYKTDCKVVPVSPYIFSGEGKKMQKRIWAELAAKLEAIEPGVMRNL